MKNKTAIQEEVVRVPSRNSRVGTWMEEDIARATWKVNGVRLPSLQTSVSLQGPLPPVGMGEWGVWGAPLGSKMKLCIQMGAAAELIWS